MKILAWPAFENKTGNPYTRLLYEAMEAEADVQIDGITLTRALAGDYDVWHVHWPDDFLSYPSKLKAVMYVAAELMLFAWARLRGAKLVWTVHDLGPHESRYPALERLFWRCFIPMVDGIVSLSTSAREEVIAQFPVLQTVPCAVVPHGHYRSAYPDPVAKQAARQQLGLPAEAWVATFIGRIRPYKNVPHLIRAFQKWDEPASRLLIAGNPVSDELAEQIAQEAAKDARIRRDLRFIENEEIPYVLGAADLVVLPYEDIMHSGTALLALSFDRPVLVPDRGAMSELQRHVGAKWVRTYAGGLTPETLADALTWAERTDRPNHAPLDDLDWARLARHTADLYRRLVTTESRADA
jgi:glycosyltransferase involved in cell wall biosynthesis